MLPRVRYVNFTVPNPRVRTCDVFFVHATPRALPLIYPAIGLWHWLTRTYAQRGLYYRIYRYTPPRGGFCPLSCLIALIQAFSARTAFTWSARYLPMIDLALQACALLSPRVLIRTTLDPGENTHLIA